MSMELAREDARTAGALIRQKALAREIEHLARDICWAEFAVRKPKDTTKAAYWRLVHPSKQSEYREDAEWLIFIVKKLKPLRILAMVDLRSRGRPVRGIRRANTYPKAA